MQHLRLLYATAVLLPVLLTATVARAQQQQEVSDDRVHGDFEPYLVLAG
jgi:hypothetical protein